MRMGKRKENHMILTDYFRSRHDLTWDYALQCGVTKGVIRLPEDEDFDVCDASHWQTVYDRFTSFGITPILIEPMPNSLHDHIKAGDEKRDEALEKVIKMFPIMEKLGIGTICFNFMAHIGWLRTTDSFPERGGALVTGFDLADFKPIEAHITEDELWENYTYFVKAIVPEAEKHGIRLALHPDDPPLAKLGDVSRIMVSYRNICRAVREICPSENLGVTMCQATYAMMGENLFDVIPKLRDKIFFVHFRNAAGNKTKFHETFHDNGELDMARLLRLYRDEGIDVPIRVDHVPQMAGEGSASMAGYTALGRLYAIGYLKGLLEMLG